MKLFEALTLDEKKTSGLISAVNKRPNRNTLPLFLILGKLIRKGNVYLLQ
jgi:hypothetical protein